ncbi:MAG: universal stress protein [Nitrospira sp.]|nr:universal stress protein [Nitrospira sp.]MCA9475786.1 universal stress protein [Nitrospira sp.]MCB9710245.1 universal stress protein [Nitrospiraceae bacterium]MDR4486579.1 universal stress protein [Nitrospirales bacterium]
MRVLLAVDGSEQSAFATEAVAALASVSHVTILHVVDLPRLTFSMLGPEIAHDMTGMAHKALQQEGEQILSRTLSQLSSSPFSPTTRMEEGTPADLIMSVAQEEGIDIILMGARGKGQVREFLLGSVSQRVLTHAHCAVLVVNKPVGTLHHLLVAIQSEEDVGRVARFLKKHPFPHAAKITILTIVPIPRSLLRGGASASEEKVEHALKSAEEFLDRAVSQVQTASYPITPLVSLGDPAQTILEESKLLEPDAIMLGIHHPSALTRFVLGSVSHTVIHHSAFPILVFR